MQLKSSHHAYYFSGFCSTTWMLERVKNSSPKRIFFDMLRWKEPNWMSLLQLVATERGTWKIVARKWEFRTSYLIFRYLFNFFLLLFNFPFMILQLVAKENKQENSRSKRHSENRSMKVRVQNLLLNLLSFVW